MLVLKLLLVPLFLLMLSLAALRWGAQVAGWLAGLPVVAGPILCILAIEQGAAFAATAAAAALGAIFASLSFGVVYAQACRRQRWPAALAVALLAWGLAAALLSRLPTGPWAACAVALAALMAAPRLFPAVAAVPARPRTSGRTELVWRMAAGAFLTLTVTWVAARAGAQWSGLLAVFPVLGIVLAVFSHRAQGPAFAAALLNGMAAGLVSFFAFCLALALLLETAGVTWAFGTAVGGSLAAQWLSHGRLARPVRKVTLSGPPP